MIRNIKLLIEYEGTNYSGWQAQKNTTKTIQHILEKALKRIFHEEVKLTGAGRTDAGVHAFAQVANFKTSSKFSVGLIQRALNGLLPKDISIKETKEVPQSFHSRYDAKNKTYRYIILEGPSRLSIGRNLFRHIPYRLDLAKMRTATKFLKGRHDFRSFCASGSNVKGTKRTINKLSIGISRQNFLGKLSSDCRFIIIDIEADGFLYNMVRNIVGTLIEVGRGRFVPSHVKTILSSKNRKNAGPTAPSAGLTLLKINY